jgi:hypothetical protein
MPKPRPSVEDIPKPDKEITRTLRVNLTEDELKENARKLADKATELDRVEEDKKRVASQYGSQVQAARGEITRLSQLLTSGYELREVPCCVWFHRPKPSQKTTIRLDSSAYSRNRTDDIFRTADEPATRD